MKLLPCPCCGYATLETLSHYEICKICWWEDDGQDGLDADEVLGGPNGELSLTEARVNFLKHGIAFPERSDLKAKSKPVSDSSKVRVFQITEDDKVIEKS